MTSLIAALSLRAFPDFVTFPSGFFEPQVVPLALIRARL
jgi:hypothetical protein